MKVLIVCRYTRLRDDPSLRWREELVSEVVSRAVAAHDIDAVVTFGRGGVSGHRNHTSLHNAMVLLCLEGRLPSHVGVYCLRTVNLLRKYSLLLDLPVSFLLASTAYVAGEENLFFNKLFSLCLLHRSSHFCRVIKF